MTSDQLRALAEAPSWVILVVLTGAILIGAIRKWWVPGWVYDREALRSDRNDETLAAVAKSLEKLAGEDRTVAEMKRSMDSLADDIRWSVRERPASKRVNRDS